MLPHADVSPTTTSSFPTMPGRWATKRLDLSVDGHRTDKGAVPAARLTPTPIEVLAVMTADPTSPSCEQSDAAHHRSDVGSVVRGVGAAQTWCVGVGGEGWLSAQVGVEHP
jgi:hypothetical protein